MMKADNINFEEKIQTTFKTLPYNTEAEQAILGAFLINNENINKVADFLLSSHFYVPLHQKIYEAIQKFNERGLIANPVTLKNYFEKEEILKEAGVDSYNYLLNLSENATIIINIESFARIIYDAAIRRSLIELGEDIVNNAYDNDINLTSQAQIEVAEQKLFNLASQGQADTGLSSIRSTVNSALEKIAMVRERGGKINGVTSGYTKLDEILGGMQSSDLIILAARPSMGKTSLAINIALNAAENFLQENAKGEELKSAGIFSLEMSSEQIVTRILAIKTGIDGSKIRNGTINKDEFVSLTKESSNISRIPMYIDDTPALSISALRTRARRMKRKHNIGILIVDYLQLLRGSGAGD